MRAKNSGIRLTEQDAATIKAMVARGDRQHDIAASFGVNAGRIAEIATGHRFDTVVVAERVDLPPPGPCPSGRDATIALEALTSARRALKSAEALVRRHTAS